ncbi:hypothetical protein EVAR_14266_1 [Eumeta japonica]|uniref:Uncharacterized protein n=1 Tax=Eumeta variegata TaxID=151549 RepID=A0A4C1WC52_EUMVA|nr:hypothetical protein EVAR_14266_1 [Eumeta japonica]
MAWVDHGDTTLSQNTDVKLQLPLLPLVRYFIPSYKHGDTIAAPPGLLMFMGGGDQEHLLAHMLVAPLKMP